MDNWHASRQLTLNLGLRYEALPRPYEKYNRVANFVPSDYNPADAPIFNSDGSINAMSPGVWLCREFRWRMCRLFERHSARRPQRLSKLIR